MGSKPIPPPSPPPPIRPRYVIVSLTGYTGSSDGHSNRKPVTTWTVLDKLAQSKPVGLNHYRQDFAEAERAEYEAAWEHWIETGEWIQPQTEERRRDLRYRRGGSRWRAWCGVCKRKSSPGAHSCSTCGRRLV